MTKAEPVSDLFKELHWLKDFFEYRVLQLKGDDKATPPSPPLLSDNNTYGNFVLEKKLELAERLVLALALSSEVMPQILDGVKGDKDLVYALKLYTQEDNMCLYPTVYTALILMAGDDYESSLRYLDYFDSDHLFHRQSILELQSMEDVKSLTTSLLKVSSTYGDMFIRNRPYKPRFSTEFPATPITTGLDWEDLVMEQSTEIAIDEMRERLLRNHELEKYTIFRHKRPGFRLLFYGDPGTGKTLTASLLGKLLKRDVYRIDVSAVVSKYVGETNQRLSSLFNIAENKDWVLFFDEGDALLGKRNEGGSNSHYANQEVAFLLQRIERFNGIVVVATNHENNLDEAYDRRFEMSIKFKIPGHEQMIQFWHSLIPKELPLENPQIIEELRLAIPLAPAYIVAVVERAIILTLKAGRTTISSEDLRKCVTAVEYKIKLRSANKGGVTASTSNFVNSKK
jgi:hypothetical protein